ncbi:MAG: hypothetical protein LBB76_08665, partial [Azoarcus sp.]|nr:hypothetical protein [Azoarcus sp.]
IRHGFITGAKRRCCLICLCCASWGRMSDYATLIQPTKPTPALSLRQIAARLSSTLDCTQTFMNGKQVIAKRKPPDGFATGLRPSQ